MPDAFRSLVIVNRAAAAGATGRRFERIAGLLRHSLGDFRCAFTRSAGDATRLSRGALEEGFEMVVAVGGDGTLNEVVGGFFEGPKPVNPDAVLGVICLGTGSDFGRTLQQRDLESACARLADRNTQRIDVGLARFAGHDGAQHVRPFINVASFGVSGLVAKLVNSRLKALSGQLAFTLATVRALAVHRDHTVTLQFDDHPPQSLALTNGAFGNGRYFGAGMQVAPAALIDDGQLDVTLWSGFGLSAFIRLRRALYDGTHVREPGVHVSKARQVRVSSAARVLVELDGESVGTLPLQVELLPGALRLKV